MKLTRKLTRRFRLTAATLACAAVVTAALAATTTVNVSNGTVEAGAQPTTLNFPLSRSGDIGYEAVMMFQSSNGTAIAGTDYTAASGRLVLPAGITSASIPVTVAASALQGAAAKTFTLQLTPSAGLGDAATFNPLAAVPMGVLPNELVATDLDGDGDNDLVTAINGSGGQVTPSGQLAVSVNRSAQNATAPDFDPGFGLVFGQSSIRDIQAADLNADGKPDLIALGPNSNGAVGIFINTSTTANQPSFAGLAAITLNTNSSAMAVADFDGDGKRDLAITRSAVNKLSIFVNATADNSTSAVFSTTPDLDIGPSPQHVVTADFNGDGKPDLLTANVSTGNQMLTLLTNTTTAPGAPTFTITHRVTPANTNNRLVVSDFNLDDKPDFAVRADSASALYVYLNTTQGNTTSFADVVTLSAPGNDGVAAGDYNRDGRPDLAIARRIPDTNTGVLRFLRNRTPAGSNTAVFDAFDDANSVMIGTNPRLPVAADFNRDGVLDLAALNGQREDFSHSATLSVVINSSPDGLPTVTPASVTGTITYPAAPIPDTTPDAFSFTAQDNVARNTITASNSITVAGINAPAAISVTGGAYSIGCNPDGFANPPATISNGQSVCVRHASSAQFSTPTTTTLSIGGVSANFVSTTHAADTSADIPGSVNPGGLGGTIPDPESRTLSLALNSGTLVSPRRVPTPVATMPAGMSFPYGFIAFDITTTMNGSVIVTLTAPVGGPDPIGYVKCNAGVCSAYPGAVVVGRTVQITLTDGSVATGDSDATANGIIRDPGAIAVAPTAASGGGGGSMPALGLLGLLGVFWVRRSAQSKSPRASRDPLFQRG